MNFEEKIGRLLEAARSRNENNRLAGNAWFLGPDGVVTYPRGDGDSRYPYGSGGFNFWAYSSGYMFATESTFVAFNQVQEGAEPNIAFFAGLPDGGGAYEPVPLLGVPAGLNEGAERFTVFTPKAAYYFTFYRGLEFCVRVFADDRKVMLFSVGVKNNTGRPMKLYLSSYLNPYIRYGYTPDPNIRWWKTSRMAPQGAGVLPGFLVETAQDVSRTEKIGSYGVVLRSIGAEPERSEATASRRRFMGGKSGSLFSAAPLKAGTFGAPCHFCTFTDVAVFGDINHIAIPSGEFVRSDVSFTVTHDAKEAQALSLKSLDSRETDGCLEELEKNERESSGRMALAFGEFNGQRIRGECFNNFIAFVKRQVEFCALGKSYGGDMLGIRDVFQQIEAALLWQPEKCADKILEALSYTAPNGRCPRQYSYPVGDESPYMDLRPFIDQGAWVISTIVTYLRVTRDFDFLKRECGYYEIVNPGAGAVKKSAVRDSVLDHMIRITHYLNGSRDTGFTNCVRALYGDWNDALDGLGVSGDPGTEYGTGVSVMATLQVYRNMNEMTELLSLLNPRKYRPEIEEYASAREEIRQGLLKYAVVEQDGKKKILHGWGDKRSYVVGGFRDVDGECRTGLASNAFWVLSGMYELDPGIRETLLTAFRSLDSQYGLKTFDVPFAPGAPGVGRIVNLPAGTAENAASYIHASLFGVAALFKMGCSGEAWKQLFKSLPITHSHISTSPFIMPNSYCCNPEINIDGESMSDWHTGSANVLIKTLVRFAVGFEPQYGGVWIQPAACQPSDEFDFRVSAHGCRFSIQYRNCGTGERTFMVNGNVRPPIFDRTAGIRKIWIPNEEMTGPMTVEITD